MLLLMFGNLTFFSSFLLGLVILLESKLRLFSRSNDQGLISCPFIKGNQKVNMFHCLTTLIILTNLMKTLPSNIRDHLKKFSSKMTGTNQAALNSIRIGVAKFNKERCEENKLRHIDIAAFEDEKGIENQLFYVIRLKGRKNTYYHRRIIVFYMFVFDSYPQQPPQIIAGNLYDSQEQKERRFLHMNVSQSGHFCMGTNQSNEQYYEYTTLRDILIELENAVYNPNITSSYNNKLYETFTAKGNNEKYYKQLNNQARLMQVADTSSSDEESSNEK